MMNTRKIYLSLIILFFSTNVFAQQQRVAVFKNGTGFFFNPMVLEAQDGKFIVKDVPEALFGTLWFYTDGKPLKSLKSYEGTVKETTTRKAKSLYEVLAANEGRQVTINLRDKDKDSEAIVGRIQRITPEVVMLYANFVVGESFMGISLKDISSFSFSNMPSEDYAPTSKKRVIEIEFEKTGSEKEAIEMAYLRKGISWFPNYLVTLKDDNKAEVVLRAQLINDAQDLNNANLSMVVGAPNFMFNHLASPFSSNISLERFLNQLNGNRYASGRYGGVLSNAITTQSADYEMGFDDVAGGGGSTEDLETSSREDLFFYTKKGVSLPKGGRALYALFAEQVDYKHIFEVTLPANNGYSIRYKSKDHINEVYHSIELQNSTKFPWTTGTAMVNQEKNNVPEVLSQDMMKYTAKSAKTMLRLSTAPDILVKDKEIQLSRKSNVKEKGIVYDIVTAQGTIEIKNHKKEDINLKISRYIIGKMLETDFAWNIEKRADYHRYTNETNDVSWEVKLGAAETKTITYSYTFYVRK